LEIAGEAFNGKEALKKIKAMSVPPDVILMDIAMPGMDGIQTTKEILKFDKYAKIIMLTAFGSKDYILDSFDAGALGFIRKDGGLNLIRDAICQAASGGFVPLQKEVSRHLLAGKNTTTDKVELEESQNIIRHDQSGKTTHEIEFIEKITRELLEQSLICLKHMTGIIVENAVSQFDKTSLPKNCNQSELIINIKKSLENSVSAKISLPCDNSLKGTQNIAECLNCSTGNKVISKFCRKCGAKLGKNKIVKISFVICPDCSQCLTSESKLCTCGFNLEEIKSRKIG